MGRHARWNVHREMALCVMDLAEWASGANMDRTCVYVLLQRITCSNRSIMLTSLAIFEVRSDPSRARSNVMKGVSNTLRHPPSLALAMSVRDPIGNSGIPARNPGNFPVQLGNWKFQLGSRGAQGGQLGNQEIQLGNQETSQLPGSTGKPGRGRVIPSLGGRANRKINILTYEYEGSIHNFDIRTPTALCRIGGRRGPAQQRITKIKCPLEVSSGFLTDSSAPNYPLTRKHI